MRSSGKSFGAPGAVPPTSSATPIPSSHASSSSSPSSGTCAARSTRPAGPSYTIMRVEELQVGNDGGLRYTRCAYLTGIMMNPGYRLALTYLEKHPSNILPSRVEAVHDQPELRGHPAPEPVHDQIPRHYRDLQPVRASTRASWARSASTTRPRPSTRPTRNC